MQSPKNFEKKNRITEAILTGAVAMLIVFVISLFLPKEWLVSGKIVVFPSGQPVSASSNLLPEVGNTAEMIKSESFQKNNFGSQMPNFAGAKALKDSSTVLVKFRSSENDIQSYEDLIVKIPSEVNDYARDLYSGSPFKYKMISDPEISASPVRPNLLLNAVLGFVAGFVLYLLYWYGFGSKRKNDKGEIVQAKVQPVIVSPEIKPAKADEQNIGQGKVVMENGRPAFVPTKTDETKSSAPENLPVASDESTSTSANLQEPSDEEVKERLNRLMRGEL